MKLILQVSKPYYMGYRNMLLTTDTVSSFEDAFSTYNMGDEL